MGLKGPGAAICQPVTLMRNMMSLLVLCSTVNSFSADRIQFQSGTNHTALIELYTSEGCSSCPPAEESFSKLKAHPGLWLDFVPAAFHVDYWDYLGWRDPFGSEEYSKRQRAYAAEWKSRSVYTPGFVLDGKEARGWFNPDKPPRHSQQATGTLTLSTEDGNRWRLRFEPGSRRPTDSFVFYATLLGCDLSSNVKAGENRGRKLNHDFVVLELTKAASTRSRDSFEAELSLKPGSRALPKRFAVAAWVTGQNDLQPLQAVGGWLPENH